jgi:hypothetical protein
MIKRNHPSWYIPGAPMNIGDALKHLDEVEPDGSAVAYQDALEAVHTHIRRMGAEYTELSTKYAALFGAVERARAELAPANVTLTPGGNYFKRPWDEPSPPLEPAPPRFDVNADPPVYPSWEDTRKAPWPDPTPEMLSDPTFNTIWEVIKRWDINVPGQYVGHMGATGNHVRAILDALTRRPDEPSATGALFAAFERVGFKPALPIWSDEQFAKIKAEWEGFVPREGLGQGQPECTTCERRVQEGEQPPFPTVQARQWINHGGRVWTRLCEACKARKDPT